MAATDKKIVDFLNLLSARTIEPIDNTDIKESCTATLLLIFAAVDSLSKITCTNEEYAQFTGKTGNKVRFKNFLEKLMGDGYARLKDELYDLRNDIVHTGINTKVILSKYAECDHLKEVDGHLWVNTSRFLDDLKETIRQIYKDIDTKGPYFQNAANRLQELNIIDVDQDAMPSAGPAASPFR